MQKKKPKKQKMRRPGVVVHTFNSIIEEAETGRFLNSSPAWSTKQVSGQPELHSETINKITIRSVRTLTALAEDAGPVSSMWVVAHTVLSSGPKRFNVPSDLHRYQVYTRHTDVHTGWVHTSSMVQNIYWEHRCCLWPHTPCAHPTTGKLDTRVCSIWCHLNDT